MLPFLIVLVIVRPEGVASDDVEDSSSGFAFTRTSVHASIALGRGFQVVETPAWLHDDRTTIREERVPARIRRTILRAARFAASGDPARYSSMR